MLPLFGLEFCWSTFMLRAVVFAIACVKELLSLFFGWLFKLIFLFSGMVAICFDETCWYCIVDMHCGL